MKRPKKQRGTAKAREPETVTLSRADNLKIWGMIVASLGVILLCIHCEGTRKQTQTLDNLLAQWRTSYHLSGEQARRIRAMEESFHGRGDPFFAPAHTREEITVHHRAIASVMNPEDGERFFKAQEGSAATR